MEAVTQPSTHAPAKQSPRRIILFVYWLAHGGMEQQTINLAHGYATRGDHVTIGYVQMKVDPEPLLAAGISLVDLRARGPLRRLLSIPRFARLARRADVVHCTGWDASAWGRVAGWLARRPVVVTEHSSAGRETHVSFNGRSSGWIIALHNRMLDPVTSATVAVARTQIDQLKKEGVRASKIHHIPNGLPLEPVREAARDGVTRTTLGIPDSAKVLIHIGRFIPQKRQDWTYEAVRQLRPELGDIHVIFAGKGRTLEALQQQALADGSDWAHFLGHRRDVPALLSISDIAVLPSAAEALPMVMIEALCLGIPQVATEAGDVREVLEGSGAGIVVGRDDKEGFIGACQKLLGDPGVALKMREAALAVADSFAVETMVDRYEGLFDEVIAGRRGGLAVNEA